MNTGSRVWFFLNLVLATGAIGLGAMITWDLAHVRGFPTSPSPPTALRAAMPPPWTERQPAAAYDAVAAGNLFNSTRSEVAAVAAVPVGPKPVLHGVLVDGVKSRAYLEDPVAKRVYGYAVGDTAGGGQIEQIATDRVVIRRPDGVIEVLLQDPKKPKPAPLPATTGNGSLPPGPGTPAPTASAPTPGGPSAHGSPTLPAAAQPPASGPGPGAGPSH